MSIVLGIESTAHTFGVAVVKNGKILSNVKKVFTTEKGGMVPMDVARFHSENKHEIYFESLDGAGINELDIDAVAFSQGPGLAPCLLEGMKFAKEICKKLNVPLVPVNHCIAHLEIGKITGAKNPVMLYVSGANTQIIAYASGKYRIFGETLDLGVGNFIDSFGRYAGIGFPAGPKIEELARTRRVYPEEFSTKILTKGKKLAMGERDYIELPYKVKGMDIAVSGILTNLRQKLSEYKIEDLAYSMQETVFAMLVETAERALAHTGKKELLLGGGVACNKRLQEMCRIMCRERNAKLFIPEKQFLVDNAGMIAFLGEIVFKKYINALKGVPRNFSKEKFTRCKKNLEKIDIKPRQRTDEVNVDWK